VIIECDLNTVIGGFHLMRTNIKNPDSKVFLNELSVSLINSNVNKFYTCHCTGEQACSYLCNTMNNLNELKTGMVIEI